MQKTLFPAVQVTLTCKALTQRLMILLLTCAKTNYNDSQVTGRNSVLPRGLSNEISFCIQASLKNTTVKKKLRSI